MARDYVFAGRAFYDFFPCPARAHFTFSAMPCGARWAQSVHLNLARLKKGALEKKFNWSSFNGDG